MNTSIYTREMKESDLPIVKSIIDDTQLFPSEYLDDMALGYLNQESEEKWFVAEDTSGDVVGLSYCSPERMTEGTWNVLLIAVFKRYQGSGIGSQLMTHVEYALQQNNVRVLLVETSGLPEYTLTRAFYPKCGYTQVACIPEYYDKGDDKIVFWKQLN